jgi:hypothetical protein
MKEFIIPQKLVSLTEMTMKTTLCKVRMAQGTTKEFLVKRGLRQGDVLSELLFNLALEKVVRQLPINPV